MQETLTQTKPPPPPEPSQSPDASLETRVGHGLGQVLLLGAGIVFLVLGSLALAETGIDTALTNLTHVTVAGLDHTSLMALIELGAGLALIISGAQRAVDWSTMRLLGAAGLAFGVVLIAEPAALHRALGAHANTGWLFGIIGGVLLATGIMYPMVTGDEDAAPQ